MSPLYMRLEEFPFEFWKKIYSKFIRSNSKNTAQLAFMSDLKFALQNFDEIVELTPRVLVKYKAASL